MHVAIMEEAPRGKIIFIKYQEVSRGMYSRATHRGTILGIPTSDSSLSESLDLI